jgi:hypothetical protein
MSVAEVPLLQVGSACTDITPPLGAYDGRLGKQVEVIADPVTARVIYLEQPGGEEPVVLAMGDFGGITHDTDRRLRRLIGEAVGVSPLRVRINASHNHTCIGGYRTTQQLYETVGHQFLNLEWFEQTVEAGFVEAACRAQADRREATVAVGAAPVAQVISNRSYVDEEGVVRVRFGVSDEQGRQAPRGLYDPDLYALSFRDATTDQPIVTVINVACHATSLASRGQLISPDFPGYAVGLVEQATGGPAFYLHGAGGNVGPGRDADGTLEGAKVLAGRIAEAALLALRRARPCPPAPLHLHTWTQPIDLRPDLPNEAVARRDFEQCAAQPSPSISELWRRAALLEVVSQREVVSQCELFVLHHGDWCLAGLPGESFVESQLAIRGASPVPFTLVGGYYDTTLWYIPTWQALRSGGYEAAGGWTYTAPGTSERLTRSVIARLGAL